VSRLFTVNYKRDRVTISKQCLEMFQRNPDEFLRSLLWTKHRSIIFFETKEQSKQWISPDESASKKAKTVKAGRVMATIFWDTRDIIRYRLSSVEANDQWRLLRSLMDCFNILKKKTSSFGKEESALLSRQCTSSHVPGTDSQIQRIPLRIASPSSIFVPIDLASCDYFLFLNLKK